MDMDILFVVIDIVVVVGIVGLMIYAVINKKDISEEMEKANKMLKAREVARTFAEGIEQMGENSDLESHEKFDMVKEQLLEVFPELTYEQAEQIIESAVFGINQTKRLTSRNG